MTAKKKKKKRIAILTGGGDCPGLNAVIRAVVKTAQNVHGWEVFGVKNGVEGFLEPNGRGVKLLSRSDIAGILPRGGTIIGASNRCDIFAVQRGDRVVDESDRIKQVFKRKGISALITVGGDGTQRMALALQKKGIKIVGVPKTIDNDLQGTDRTFGFDTAVGVVSEAVDRLYTTAASHHRVMCVELMGRNSGFIALHGGMAGGAEVILIPEIPYDPDKIMSVVSSRRRHGRRFSIIVVAEGAKQPNGDLVYRKTRDDAPNTRLGGVSFRVTEELRERSEAEVRNVVLGHMQRGGTPSALDRLLASAMGQHAVTLIEKRAFGEMVALRGTKITSVPIERAVRSVRKVSPRGQLVRAARDLGISFAAADGSDDEFAAARHRHGAP